MLARGLRHSLQTARITIRTASRSRPQRQTAHNNVNRTEDEGEIDAKRVAISNFWNKHLPKKSESRVTIEVEQNDEYEAWMLKRRGQSTFESAVAEAIAEVDEEDPAAAEYERWRKDRYRVQLAPTVPIAEPPVNSVAAPKPAQPAPAQSGQPDPSAESAAPTVEKTEEADPVPAPAAPEPAFVRTGVLPSDPYIVDAPTRGQTSVFPHLKVDTIPSDSSQLSGTSPFSNSSMSPAARLWSKTCRSPKSAQNRRSTQPSFQRTSFADNFPPKPRLPLLEDSLQLAAPDSEASFE